MKDIYLNVTIVCVVLKCGQAVANGIMIHWFEMQPVGRSVGRFGCRTVCAYKAVNDPNVRENRLH